MRSIFGIGLVVLASVVLQAYLRGGWPTAMGLRVSGTGAGNSRSRSPGVAAEPLPKHRPPRIRRATCSGHYSRVHQSPDRQRFRPGGLVPGDHPTMPDIVAHGSQPDVRACSLCHYPNGKGRAENAGISGFPVSYFIEQMHEFREATAEAPTPVRPTPMP